MDLWCIRNWLDGAGHFRLDVMIGAVWKSGIIQRVDDDLFRLDFLFELHVFQMVNMYVPQRISELSMFLQVYGHPLYNPESFQDRTQVLKWSIRT
jgi:hypothetical protein